MNVFKSMRKEAAGCLNRSISTCREGFKPARLHGGSEVDEGTEVLAQTVADIGTNVIQASVQLMKCVNDGSL